MNSIKNYLNDGADYQSRAVLAYLQDILDIDDEKVYSRISRWENGRENGYVIMVYDIQRCNQINIAFFEHRNTDSIHAVMWYQKTFNCVNFETANFDGKYKSSFDTDFSASYGQALEMASWINDRVNELLQRLEA